MFTKYKHIIKLCPGEQVHAGAHRCAVDGVHVSVEVCRREGGGAAEGMVKPQPGRDCN